MHERSSSFRNPGLEDGEREKEACERGGERERRNPRRGGKSRNFYRPRSFHTQRRV